MVLTLVGFPLSTCTRRVAVVLQEKQVPYKFVAVDPTKGEHKKPEYLANQPFGQVPYIDDDGFILYESRAICRYIEEKYPNQGTKLIPTDPKQRALFEQAASIETANFDVYAAPAVFEAVFKQRRGLKTDPEKVKELMTALAGRLDGYEKILSKQKYLAGNEVTMADLFHLPYALLLPATGSDPISERPNTARWLKELQERPSWQAIKDGVTSTV